MGDSLAGAIPRAGFEIRERGVLLAVSDGMGGHNAGEVASALVVDSLRRAMKTSRASASDDVVFERAVKSANRQVWEAAQLPGRNNHMGATLTAVFLRGATAYIAEVGDSRAYLLRRGRLVQVTHDQSFVQMLVDRGALAPEDAAAAPFKNVILQAMGQEPDVQVALGRIELRQGDCFLLCSDGLTNELGPTEIRDTILSAPWLDAACNALIELAKKRGGNDNITVLLGSLSGQLPEVAAGERVSGALQPLKEFDATPSPPSS
jgi:serine/threonine protein phosphatase PrpC